MKVIFRLVTIIVFFALSAESAKSATAVGVGPKRNTMEETVVSDLILLSADEERADAAKKRIEARPRAEWIDGVRIVLRSSGSREAGFRAALLLDLKELLPELLVEAEKTESYLLLLTINRLASEQHYPAISKVYRNRLKTKEPAAVKTAMLEGLAQMQQTLERQEFKALLNDSQQAVRVATVKQFLATRERFEASEQAARYRESFIVRPYQARLVALEHFANLPDRERKKLRRAFDKEICGIEAKDEVKAVCQRISSKLRVLRNEGGEP